MNDEIINVLEQFRQAFSEPGQFPDLESVAGYLVDCAVAERTESFDAVFNLIEHHLIYGSDDLRNAILVQLLENLKNFSSWRDVDYVIFENWLGPESHVAWRWLEKRWQGKRSLAEAARKLTNQSSGT